MRNNYKIGLYLGGLTLLVTLIVSLTFRSFDRIETAAESRNNIQHRNRLIATWYKKSSTYNSNVTPDGFHRRFPLEPHPPFNNLL